MISKICTVVVFVVVNIRKDASHLIGWYVYDLPAYKISHTQLH